MTLTVIRGIPGSGKSTFAREWFGWSLVLENDQFHVSDDCYRFDKTRMKAAVDWCYDTAAAALGRGMDVVVANTFTRRRFVDCYRRLAAANCADFRVYRMTGDFGSVHDVPAEVLAEMRDGFEDWPGEAFVDCLDDRRFEVVERAAVSAEAAAANWVMRCLDGSGGVSDGVGCRGEGDVFSSCGKPFAKFDGDSFIVKRDGVDDRHLVAVRNAVAKFRAALVER